MQRDFSKYYKPNASVKPDKETEGMDDAELAKYYDSLPRRSQAGERWMKSSSWVFLIVGSLTTVGLCSYDFPSWGIAIVLIIEGILMIEQSND